MRIRSAIASVALSACFASTAHAQERPNLSGTWVATTGPTASTAKPAPPVWGPEITIADGMTELTVRRTFTTGPAVIKYAVNGAETTSRMPARLCEPDSEVTWTAARTADALVIRMTGVTPANGKTIAADVTATLRLETADTLRIDVAARATGQSAPRATSTVYRRSSASAMVAAPAPAAGTKATLNQLAWISGVWIGTSGTTTFEERWTPSAGGSMIGVSRTLRDGLMSAFEFLCIVERDRGLVYQAMPNGRSPATDFTLTAIDETTAVFENPAHDFPKTIRYAKRADGTLEAIVSGAAGSKPQTFVFRRQE